MEKTNTQAGFVYVVSNAGGVKIGYSLQTPHERIRQLQTASPQRLLVIALFHCANARRAETVLHEKFCTQRLNGEWFRLRQNDIDWIRRLASGEIWHWRQRNKMSDRIYLTRTEAADYLRLSVSQVDTLAREGKIQRAKFGDGPRARVLYRRSDLDAYFDAHIEPLGHDVQATDV